MTDFHALSGRWLLLSRPSGHAPEPSFAITPLNRRGGWKGAIQFRDIIGKDLTICGWRRPINEAQADLAYR
jgi:hypothetical protein